jgi:hypothetical protein
MLRVRVFSRSEDEVREEPRILEPFRLEFEHDEHTWTVGILLLEHLQCFFFAS